MTDTSATLGKIGEILERAKQAGRVITWRSGIGDSMEMLRRFRASARASSLDHLVRGTRQR